MSRTDLASGISLDAPRPAGSAERIGILDALRGFALLGIFVANLMYFSGWFFLSPEAQEALAGLVGTRGTEFLNLAFIDGKFYTIFSLLFGIGFAVQLQRLSDRGVDFRRLYLRRITGLLVIGLVHLCLVWEGDILTLYALCGFVLLALRNWSSPRLFKVALALIALPVPAYALFWLAGWGSPGAALQDWGYAYWRYLVGWPVGDADALEQLRRGGLDGFLDWTLSGPLFRWATYLDNWRIPKGMGVFILGVCAGREIMAGRLLADCARLRRICLLGFVIGLPANLALAWMGGLPFFELNAGGLLATGLYAVGVAPLGLAYAAGFALLWRRGERYLRIFSPAGRMALTNYLMQTVIAIGIFYGVGLGLAGQLAPAAWVGLGLTVFAGQIAFSRLWLFRFRFGPVEWLWRCATYGRWFPLLPAPRPS